jgi:hypothetical protein
LRWDRNSTLSGFISSRPQVSFCGRLRRWLGLGLGCRLSRDPHGPRKQAGLGLGQISRVKIHSNRIRVIQPVFTWITWSVLCQSCTSFPKTHGIADLKLEDNDVTLSDGAHSLFSNGGTATVIYAKADDYETDPAGNSGDRIACGVITK